MKKQTTLRIPDDLKADLTDMAMRMGVSQNEMMEICLLKGLAATRSEWYAEQRSRFP